MLCEQLKTVRKLNKFTQQQTADALGIERSTYASYETGRNRPDVAILEKFAKIFGVAVDTILSVETGGNLSINELKSKYGNSKSKNLLSSLSKDEQNIIAEYRLCSEKEKNEILKLIKNTKEKKKK